jgi:serine/threonine-protein kinase
MGPNFDMHVRDGAVAQTEQLPQIGDVIANKYRVDRLLGSGGMGAVFVARHLVTDKRVALKWMLARPSTSAEDIERFIGEARAAARIAHPNIVDIYDVGEHRSSLYLVMEFLPGRCFTDAMRGAPLPAVLVLQTLLPVMHGLLAAHRRGVVHRDLKPDNIFLCCDDEGEPLQAKVLDFGISKMREVGSLAAASLTQTGTVMGTPNYIAPEQAVDSRLVDARADIYSMGVILYEALSGTLPYEAESLTALLAKIAHGQPAQLRVVQPNLPPRLAEAVMKAMALEPSDRFDDMAALIGALTPFASATAREVTATLQEHASVEAGAAARRAPDTDAQRKPATLRQWPWVAGLLALALAAAAWALAH